MEDSKDDSKREVTPTIPTDDARASLEADIGLVPLTRGLTDPTLGVLNLNNEVHRGIAVDVHAGLNPVPLVGGQYHGKSIAGNVFSAAAFDSVAKPFGLNQDVPFGAQPWNKTELTPVFDVVPSVPKADAQPPLCIGGYLEPNYHFFSKWPADRIMANVESVLKTYQKGKSFVVDFEKIGHKFKFKACAYSQKGGACTPFVVRVFSLEDSDNLAVEFQRRSGDPVQFCRLYRECLQGFKNMIDAAKSTVPGPLFQPPPFKGLQEATAEQGRETVSALTDMLDSNLVDVMSEAACALTDLANDTLMQPLLLEDRAMDSLSKACSSSSEDVHRCALMAMQKLAEQRGADAASKIVARGCVKVVVERTSSSCRQVQRTAVRLLADLSRAGVSLCTRDDVAELTAMMDNLQTSEDSDVQASCKAVLQHMRKAVVA